MSAVSKYITGLANDVETALEGPINTPQAHMRIMSVHSRLRTTMRSEAISDEQRRTLDALHQRVLIEGFGLDLDSIQKENSQ